MLMRDLFTGTWKDQNVTMMPKAGLALSRHKPVITRPAVFLVASVGGGNRIVFINYSFLTILFLNKRWRSGHCIIQLVLSWYLKEHNAPCYYVFTFPFLPPNSKALVFLASCFPAGSYRRRNKWLATGDPPGSNSQAWSKGWEHPCGRRRLPQTEGHQCRGHLPYLSRGAAGEKTPSHLLQVTDLTLDPKVLRKF